MSDSTEDTPCLVNFFIFYTLHDFPEDDEYNSIIFYHPPDTSKDVQLKETGKTAAILKFSQYLIDLIFQHTYSYNKFVVSEHSDLAVYAIHYTPKKPNNTFTNLKMDFAWL